MKFTSTIYFAKTAFSFFLVIWMVILVLITLNSVLSCVDKNGCLRDNCNFKKFNNKYYQLVMNYQIKCYKEGLIKTNKK